MIDKNGLELSVGDSVSISGVITDIQAVDLEAGFPQEVVTVAVDERREGVETTHFISVAPQTVEKVV